MNKSFVKPLTATGLYTMTAYAGEHYLSGWYFTETSGGTNSITVVIKQDSSTGTILEDLLITANNSVGEDYAVPIALSAAVYVTVSGSGTCQGHVRGR